MLKKICDKNVTPEKQSQSRRISDGKEEKQKKQDLWNDVSSCFHTFEV